MSAKLDATRLAAFVDGELSLDDQLAVEAQLREDAAARAEVDAMRALRDQLKHQASYHAAPAALRRFADELVPADRMADAHAENVGARATPQRRANGPRLRFRLAAPWLASASGLALVLLLSFHVLLRQIGGDDALLQQEAVAGHVRASLSQRRVDVVSSERHTVKPWLSARLDYSPPVPELHRPGLVFEGARLDYLDGRPVAVLVYQQGQHQVDAYVWPSAQEQSAKPVLSLLKGFRVARWTQQGMRHCVVSDVNEEEFAALVTAFQQAGETR